MHALLGYAFGHLDLQLVKLETFGDNERAQTAFKKVGFREVRRQVGPSGRVDVYMEIGRGAFMANGHVDPSNSAASPA